MSFSTSWRALTTRAFSEKGSEFLSYDMLYQLSYMSAVASAGISRTRIIEFACDLPCYARSARLPETSLSEAFS